jgi:hypothetical protein
MNAASDTSRKVDASSDGSYISRIAAKARLGPTSSKSARTAPSVSGIMSALRYSLRISTSVDSGLSAALIIG